jgi:hypothetical protein
MKPLIIAAVEAATTIQRLLTCRHRSLDAIEDEAVRRIAIAGVLILVVSC